MPTLSHLHGIDSPIVKERFEGRPTFRVACWLLGLLAFVQLVSIGSALVIKTEKTVQVNKNKSQFLALDDEKIVPRSQAEIIADAERSIRYFHLRKNRGSTALLTSRKEKSHRTRPPVVLALPSKNGNAHGLKLAKLPPIANPRVERLLQEARKLHLESDMMRAMLKLEEAERIDPNECAIIYQKGILFEDMGSFMKAADQYQKIQQMGVMKAKGYFKLATEKLTQGMDTEVARLDVLAIGPVKVSGATESGGKHVEVAITLLGRPDKMINSDDVEVQIYFYNKLNNGKIEKAMEDDKVDFHWVSNKVDWQDVGNEETLRVSYSIPSSDEATNYLLGDRRFYGYVIELVYKGEVVDQKAYPSRLNSIHYKKEITPYKEDSNVPWLPDGSGDDLLPDKNLNLKNGASK